MNREEVKQRIKEYIWKNNHVSYVELERFMDEIGYDYRGNYDILSPMCDHVVFWVGWSQEAIDLMNELNTEELIHKEPAQFLVYLLDGGGLDMPIVKSFRQYKQDHWLPVVFCKGAEKDWKR